MTCVNDGATGSAWSSELARIARTRKSANPFNSIQLVSVTNDKLVIIQLR